MACAHEESKVVIYQNVQKIKTTSKKQKAKGFWIANQQYYPVISIVKNNALP